MPVSHRFCLGLCAAAVVIVLAAGCGSKSASGPSKSVVRTATAADVVNVLNAHNVDLKGTISCFGQAPGIVDCNGSTASGTSITATLNASASGKSCTGPMVVNVGTMHYSESDEKCS